MDAHEFGIHSCIGEANRVEIFLAQGDVTIQAILATVIQSGRLAASIIGQRCRVVGVGSGGAGAWKSVMRARVGVGPIVIGTSPPRTRAVVVVLRACARGKPQGVWVSRRSTPMVRVTKVSPPMLGVIPSGIRGWGSGGG